MSQGAPLRLYAKRGTENQVDGFRLKFGAYTTAHRRGIRINLSNF